MVLSTLRVKQPVILPSKWVYLGIAKELQLGHASCDKTVWKLERNYGEEEEAGGTALNGSHWRKVRVQGSYGFSLAECDVFLLAKLVAGRGEILPLVGTVK